MKYKILFILFIGFNSLIYSQKVAYPNLDNYNLLQLFKDSLRVSQIENAIKKVILFLEKEDSLHKNIEYNELINQLEYKEFIPSNYIFYEIIALEKINNSTDIFNIACIINYGNNLGTTFRGILKIGFNYKENKIIFPFFNKNYNLYKTKFFHFINITKPNYQKYHHSINFANKTIDFIQKNYQKFKLPKKPSIYIVNNKNNIDNNFEYFGVEYSFNTSGRYLKSINTIIDGKSNGYYKHEIVHYLLQNYNFNNFIGEAISTYLSSGQAGYNTNSQLNWNQIIKKIQTDTGYVYKLNSGAFLKDGILATEQYLIGAFLLYKLNKKILPKTFYIELFEKIILLNNEESLNYIKAKLNIIHLTDFLIENKNNTWFLK